MPCKELNCKSTEVYHAKSDRNEYLSREHINNILDTNSSRYIPSATFTWARSWVTSSCKLRRVTMPVNSSKARMRIVTSSSCKHRKTSSRCSTTIRGFDCIKFTKPTKPKYLRF